jgi:Fe-S oxidoreductase
VAALAGEVVNPPRSHDRSFCCGAGGGLTFLGEEQGTRIGRTRAQELAATGAPVVATACPFCKGTLRDALSALPELGATQLYDVAQLAAAQLRRRRPRTL